MSRRGIEEVRIVLTREPEEFAALAWDYLAADIVRNVMATVLVNLRKGGVAPGTPLFACVLDPDDRVLAAAMQTPPWPLLAADFDRIRARALIDVWLPEQSRIDSVTGPPETARAIAAAWSERTGGRNRVHMKQAMHTLTAVDAPTRPAPGRLRQASEGDRNLLTDWERAFALEAGVAAADEAPRIVERRLRSGAQFVWEDDDRPVSMLAHSPMVAGTVRIGPVYTPPQHRSRGYATSAVAAMSSRALASGASRCMLFTDLANPTSNRIYAAVGYRRCGDWEEYELIVA